MKQRAKQAAPQPLIDALESSTGDLVTGAVSEASDVQAEVRRLLAEYERDCTPLVKTSGTAKRAGTA